MSKQKTLKGSFSLFGKGLHTGLSLTVTFNPAPENHGYRIQRIDVEGEPIIHAIAENVVDTSRGTVVANGDVRCSTIEHAMAALYAMGIDNCLIPDEQFSITAMISFESQFINSQFATLDEMEHFPDEIASARTFVFVREIEPLLKAGLIKGGDLDNAIVIYEKQITQDALDRLADHLHVGHHDATKLGYLQDRPLVWQNEPARHKLLDIIGDMALIGRPIKGRIIATRPGHTINNKFARQMRREIRQHEIQAPNYDPNETPLMDVNRIRELLPHRYPMQLVDKVVETGSNYIVAVKNVTANEEFFQGHFPQEPVMPGVLQVEAMAQAGGLLVLNTVEEPERWSTYFLRLDEVKFRKKVVPGDTILFRVELMSPIRHGISSMHGFAFVGERVVMEATFTAQIVKNK